MTTTIVMSSSGWVPRLNWRRVQIMPFKRKSLHVFVFCLVSILVFVQGCTNVSENNPQKVKETNVYVAGAAKSNYVTTPCYWKNGQKTDLSKSQEDQDGSANSIFLSGSDVYVCGGTIYELYINSSFFAKIYVPCYWLNGRRDNLSVLDPMQDGAAREILVSGGDVYIAGQSEWSSSGLPYSGNPRACYWRNGQRMDFDTSLSSYGRSIWVSGSDIYVAGDYFNDLYQDVPCYWKNGQRTDLDQIEGRGLSIYVSGTDVYVAGMTYVNRFDRVPCFWKNGQRTNLSLPAGTTNGSASQIVVSGSDVYISGTIGDSDYTNVGNPHPCYWKNGQRTDLETALFGFAVSVFVSGSDIYVAGRYGETTENYHPCYWKNGQRIDLGSNVGVANSIYVEVVYE